MLRSVWRVWFVTYQGAFVMVLRIFDCALCIIAVLDLQKQHISSQYVMLISSNSKHKVSRKGRSRWVCVMMLSQLCFLTYLATLYQLHGTGRFMCELRVEY